MGVFEDSFKNHHVHAVLEKLDEQLVSLPNTELSPQSYDYIDRVQQATQYVKNRLSKTNPVLATDSRLNQIKDGFEKALSEINQYLSDGNEGRLTNASNHVEAAINNACLIPTLESGGDVASSNEAIKFKELMHRALDLTQAEASHTREELENLKQEIEKCSASIKQSREETDELVAEHDHSFKEKVSQFEKDFESAITHANNNSSELLSELESKNERAKRILNIISDDAQTGEFSKTAKKEERSANTMRGIALFSFSGMALITATILFVSITRDSSILDTVPRMLAALVLLVPGVYAAKESSRHRNLETKNKRLELELATIDAYLEEFDDSEKNRIKESLVKDFFGNAHKEEHEERDYLEKGSPVYSIIEKLVDGIANKK